MLTKEIKSLQHSLVKHCVKLRKKEEYRQAKGQVLLIGKKNVEEVSSLCSPLFLFIVNGEEVKCKKKSLEKTVVSFQVMKKITGMARSENIAAIFPLPKEGIWRASFQYILVLDGLSDPGNLGTLIRTAFALKWDCIVFTPNTVDPFNEKALIAAKGAAFFIPLFFYSYNKLQEKAKEISANIYLADGKGRNFSSLSFKNPIFLVLGNESRGTKLKKGEKVAIVMNKKADSLNVSIAGGIFLYHIRNKGK